jgi:phage baseplate assembly protein W
MPSIVTGYVGLSDKNNPLSKSAVVSKRKPYADLDITLDLNPDTKDIDPLLDLDAVKASVRNIVLTSFGERPFNPGFGTSLNSALFEPADIFTKITITNSIKAALAKYDNRVANVTIQVLDDSDNNRYVITVGFKVIAFDEVTDITVYLQRVR